MSKNFTNRKKEFHEIYNINDKLPRNPQSQMIKRCNFNKPDFIFRSKNFNRVDTMTSIFSSSHTTTLINNMVCIKNVEREIAEKKCRKNR
jgi:hypothetical protein